MTTLEIINAINELDYDYQMIDNSTKYHYYAKLDRAIDEALITITPAQAVEIYNGIKENRKSTNHGKALFAMMPILSPTTTKTKSEKKVRLFNNAWQMFKCGVFTSFAQALKAAWTRLKIVTKMKEGVVTFEYIKQDGAIRKAIGTLTDITYLQKTLVKKTPAELVKYYDVEAQGFRMFRLDRFIGLVA